MDISGCWRCGAVLTDPADYSCVRCVDELRARLEAEHARLIREQVNRRDVER